MKKQVIILICVTIFILSSLNVFSDGDIIYNGMTGVTNISYDNENNWTTDLWNQTIDGNEAGDIQPNNLDEPPPPLNIRLYLNDSYTITKTRIVYSDDDYTCNNFTVSVGLGNTSFIQILNVSHFNSSSFDGTLNDTTQVGNTILYTCHAVDSNVGGGEPAIKQFYFNGTTATLFSVCSGTINNEVLNFTFYDEGNLSFVNTDIDVTFAYHKAGETSSTYDYQGTTDEIEYSFCSYHPLDSWYINYTIEYYANDYPQRTYKHGGGIYTSTSLTEKSLYMVHSNDGIYARLKAIDDFNEPISGVSAIMNKTISGEGVIIETQTTDDSGMVKFWANPDDDYHFTFKKLGYETQQFTLRPTTKEIYSVVMHPADDEYNESWYVGINVGSWFPSNTTLVNRTNYNFGVNITSSFWTITGCTFYLFNEDLTELHSHTTGWNGGACFSDKIFNTASNDIIIARKVVELHNTTNLTFQRTYRVYYTYPSNFTLRVVIEDIQNFTDAGFDDFGRMIIAFVIIFIVVASVTRFVGITNPEGVIVLIIGLVLAFSYVGWFTMELYTYPTGVGFEHMEKYVMFYVTLLMGTGFILWRHTR